MKKFLVLIALVVAVTSFGVDPSHARRIRFSIPTAKATPAAAAKPAPVAAAPRNFAVTPGVVVTPGIAIRPPSGSAPAGAPMAVSAPMAAGAPIAAAAAGAPTVGPALDKATKSEELPARAAPVQKHFVELTSTPPQPQREIAPRQARPGHHGILCFKTAAGQCGRVE